jgi:hypothetical protein
MESNRARSIVCFVLIYTCLPLVLGWFTPVLFKSFSQPSSSDDGAVTFSVYANVSKGIDEYRNRSSALPAPLSSAILSNKLELLGFSVGLFETPTSEVLADGLRNASTILEGFWKDLSDFRSISKIGIDHLNTIAELKTHADVRELETAAGRQHIATTVRTIDDITNRVANLQTMLLDLASAVSTINGSLQVEKVFLDNGHRSAGGMRGFVKRMKIVWQGVIQPRSSVSWEQDVLDRCQAAVLEMTTIGMFSDIAMKGLNDTIWKIRVTVSSIQTL